MLELNISSTVQILENVEIKSDIQKGRRYFEGSVKFMKTLNEVLDMLIETVSIRTLYNIVLNEKSSIILQLY